MRIAAAGAAHRLATGRPLRASPCGMAPLRTCWPGRLVPSLTPDDRVLQFSPLHFDICMMELFGTWAAGGTLVTVSADTRRDAMQLLPYLQDQAVTRLFVPYVALQQLVEVAVARDLWRKALREVFSAGEQLQITEELRTFFSRTGAALHNQYGPSEAHVVTSHLGAGTDLLPGLPGRLVEVVSAHPLAQRVVGGQPCERRAHGLVVVGEEPVHAVGHELAQPQPGATTGSPLVRASRAAIPNDSSRPGRCRCPPTHTGRGRRPGARPGRLTQDAMPCREVPLSPPVRPLAEDLQRDLAPGGNESTHLSHHPHQRHRTLPVGESHRRDEPDDTVVGSRTLGPPRLDVDPVGQHRTPGRRRRGPGAAAPPRRPTRRSWPSRRRPTGAPPRARTPRSRTGRACSATSSRWAGRSAG